jgi:quercetin dioxygenase-like cupin family protein
MTAAPTIPTDATAAGPPPRWFIDNVARIHSDGALVDGAFDLVEIEARRGDMPPLHLHRNEEETFVVLEGELTWLTPGAAVRVGAGASLVAPRGEPHAYRVESERARWLVVGSPAGFARFVSEASEEAADDGFPPPGREPDARALEAAAARAGIVLLGPPGTLPSP